MKQKRFFLIVPALLMVLILALICGVIALNVQLNRIFLQQEAVYQQYLRLEHQMHRVALTICENDQMIRVYSLGDLGLLDRAEEAIEAVYGPMDRMSHEEFSQQSYQDILAWSRSDHPQPPTITLDAQGYQPEVVWYDLIDQHREPSVDAQVVFTGTQFLVEPEHQGNELDIDQVMDALRVLPEQMHFSLDDHSVLTLDVASFYIQPKVTQEHNDFDLESMLQEELENLAITIDFNGDHYTVDPAQLLTVDAQGVVVLQEEALDDLVAELTRDYTSYGHPYYFDSYMQGTIPISWLKMDHTVESGKLRKDLAEALTAMDSRHITASYSWLRNGREFSLGDTYIAVDIEYQNMVFYKDGRLILSTDVVTGAPAHGGTPRGLWSIVEFDRDCWLVGDSYREHVDYWIGVHGNYGIHDAVWRNAFGGSIYLQNGSHGCVNTPDDAMALLYETASLGTPVLFF